MWLYLKRIAGSVIVGLSLWAVALLAGCQGLGSGELPDLALASHEAKTANKDAARTDASTQSVSAAVSPADRAVLARSVDKDPKGQGRAVWIHTVEPAAEFRWRYPNLEEILARPANRQPDFPALLGDNDPVVAANAAIVLGREGDSRAKDRLVQTVRAPELPVPMRAAAVEALAHLQKTDASESLQELLKQYGQTRRGKKSPYIPELHAELIRGLARHLEPNGDPCFTEALRSPDAKVRLEALKAWKDCRQTALPIEALDLRTDGDYRIRAAAQEAIAAKRHPQAMEYLCAALADNDVRVRYAAIAGLGSLGGNEALAKLQKLAKDPHEAIRVQAIGALASAKAEQAVLEAASDQSWRVRQKVAEALALFPNRDAAATADRLLEDFSAEVQLATVQALDAWPLERSAPILLTAMGKSAFGTRKVATAQLSAKWTPAREFPVEGPQQRRAEVLKKLRQSFHEQFNVGLAASFSPATPAQANMAKASAADVAEVERLVQQGNFKTLGDYGPAVVDALEQLHFERKLLLPEPLFREVLPHYGQDFVILDHLTSQETPIRRHAAEELRELSGKQPLSRLAIARLSQLMGTETDALVWQDILTAIANDGSPQSIELAYTAAGHEAAEVRRRACEYLAAHPDLRHEPVLLTALDDKSQAVICAAEQALAAAGKMSDTKPLSRLLGSSNEEIQFETIVALIKLDNPAGKPALERLAYSRDPKIRAKAAQAMGDFPDPAFTPILIKLLNDNLTVARAALQSLPKVVGKDVAQDAGQSPATTTEQMLRWKRWHQSQTPL